MGNKGLERPSPRQRARSELSRVGPWRTGRLSPIRGRADEIPRDTLLAAILLSEKHVCVRRAGAQPPQAFVILPGMFARDC